MNIIRIRRLSEKSITLNFSLGVKIAQISPYLFMRSNRVIVSPESSKVRCDVYFFVQDSTILFQSSVAALFQYTSVETFTANFKPFRGNVIATYVLILHRHNISVHLHPSLKKPGSLLSCCSCFTQHVREKQFVTASAVKLSTQSIDRNLCYSALILGLIQSSSSFSARARHSEYFSNSSKSFTS